MNWDLHIGTRAEIIKMVANQVEWLIRERAAQGREVVLGLATGSTPLPLYAELVRRHEEEGLSFANVVSFNLDEYEGLEMYREFMWEHLFSRVDVRREKVHVPPGRYADADEVAVDYERKIAEAGGIDWQLLGIGRDGHIGFNEPGSDRETRTRRVRLAKETREDAAGNFGGIERVPTHALTMGVGTILEAQRIVMMAWGRGKREIVKRAMKGEVGVEVPASYLQEHDNVGCFLDYSAAFALLEEGAKPHGGLS